MSSAVIDTDEVSFDALHTAVDGLLETDLTVRSDDSVLDALRELQRLENRLATVEHALIAEVDARRLFVQHLCSDTAALLAGALRLTRQQARARVAAAETAGLRRSLTGESLGPVFPHVAQAQAEGAISPLLAAQVVRTIDRLPGAVTAEDGDAIEQTLVDISKTLDTREMGLACQRMTALLDPDGTLSDDAHRRRVRELTIRSRPDGSSTLSGELTAEASEKFRTVIDTLARPMPETDGIKDARSAGQRNHDALIDVCDRLLRTGTLPDSGGVTTTVVLTMSDEAWRTGEGIATTGHGTVVRAAEAIEMAGGDYRLMTVALNRTRAITAYSSAHRLFSEAQRCALAARDGGCSFPGCTIPAAWCQSDHLLEWIDGGRTAVSNGHLLCGFHHRSKNQHGWVVTMLDGRPAWYPPRWIDPKQKARFNDTHRPVIRPPDDS